MVELNKVQKIVLLSGLVLIVTMSLFPPWRSINPRTGYGGEVGYSFVADPPQTHGDGYRHTYIPVRVDANRLMVEYLAVVLLTVGGVFLTTGMGREDDGSHDVSSE